MRSIGRSQNRRMPRSPLVVGGLLFFIFASQGAARQAGTWTDWLDRDGPGGAGDYETLRDFLAVGQACEEPIEIECRASDGRSWEETGQAVTCDRSRGAICINAQQPDSEPCLDYQVRFLCPPVRSQGSYFGDPIPDIDIVLEQIPGGFWVGLDPNTEVEALRIWIPREHLAAVRDVRGPRGWTVEGIDEKGFVTVAGPATRGLVLRLGLEDGPEPFPVRIAARRPGARPISSRGKGQELLGHTIRVPFEGDCDCVTVPCPSVVRRHSARGGDQLLGGANPLQGLNVAKSKCQRCDCSSED